MLFNRLLAVDPSVTCSGWALFDLKGEALKGVGRIHSLNASHAFSERMSDLQDKIRRLFETLKITEGDVILCESPTTMRDPSAAIKVEQVRCVFESLAREAKAIVPGRINPRSVHYEILGLKGRQEQREVVKIMAVGAANNLYGAVLKNMGIDLGETNKNIQDIIDAVLLGHLGISKIKAAQTANVEIHQYFKSLQNHKRSSSWRSANIPGVS